jgi:hypothetical protein
MDQPSSGSTPLSSFLAKNPFTVPQFYHGPPPSICGTKRWPASPDHQSWASTSPLSLLNVYVLIAPFLDHRSQQSCCCTSTLLRFGEVCTPLWYYRPWSPYRRRLWGFGTPATGRSTNHDKPAWIGTLSHIWTYLDPLSNACSQVCQSWKSYIDLRIVACRTSVVLLRHAFPTLSKNPPLKLSRARAQLYASALH